VRRAAKGEDLICVDHEEVDRLIEDEQVEVLDRLRSEVYPKAPVSLLTASATQLPIADESVDFILTSPPYLTRIDYAVAYARELAIIGLDITSDRMLREQLMGTTLIRPQPAVAQPYGPLAQDLLDQVSRHSSRASGGYYRKQIRQYLDDLTASLDQVTRVARIDASMTMVVQDSYYKEIPIHLAKICAEEANRRGWKVKESEQFEVARLLTTLNKAARAYPKGKVAETVMTLKRGSNE